MKINHELAERLAQCSPGGSKKLAFPYLYPRVVGTIKEYSGIPENQLPDLACIHSISGDIYSLATKENKVVVYDESYGLSLTNITRCFNSYEPESNDIYREYIDILIKQFYINNKLIPAAFYSLKKIGLIQHSNAHTDWLSNRKAQELAEGLIEAQILFAISHEVGHTCFDIIPNRDRIEESIKKTLQRKKQEQSNYLSYLINDFETAEQITILNLTHCDNPEIRLQEHFATIDNFEETIQESLNATPLDDLQMMEECICDYFAYSIVTKSLCANKDLNLIRAISICMISSYFNWIIADVKNDANFFCQLTDDILSSGIFVPTDYDKKTPYDLERMNLVFDAFIFDHVSPEDQKTATDFIFKTWDRIDDTVATALTRELYYKTQDEMITRLSEAYKNRIHRLEDSSNLRQIIQMALVLSEKNIREV